MSDNILNKLNTPIMVERKVYREEPARTALRKKFPLGVYQACETLFKANLFPQRFLGQHIFHRPLGPDL